MAIDPGMSFAAYLAHEAYGSSDLKAFKIGPPAMVPWRRKFRGDDTAATRVGSAAHCLILTPALFDDIYVVKPEGMTFASKEGKAWRDAQGGKTILTFDEWLAVTAASNAFADCEAMPAALVGARIENSVFWTCENSGLPCKGRPDWFTGEAVYDLKVSVTAEKPAGMLPYIAHANGWLNQLAHNRAGLRSHGINVKVGRLVIVSPNPPARVHLLEVRENDMDFLELDNENTRRGMMACHRSGDWPGLPGSWQVMELPASAAFTESDLTGAEEALPL